MNSKITKLAEELRRAIIEDVSGITVSVSVFMNHQGCEFAVSERTREGLRRDSISMRNIGGEFI